jgi:hypothetical protein
MPVSMPWVRSRILGLAWIPWLIESKSQLSSEQIDPMYCGRHCCRNFGTVSIVGVDGGFLDKIPMGSAINRGLTFRMAQTPVQHYLGIEKGEIDPSFVITHRATLEEGPALYDASSRQ